MLMMALGLLTTSASAQTESFGFVSSNPGARSRGLGGAFAAMADDATAAFANPAGLAQLIRPEISAELRFTLNDTSNDAFDTDADVTGLGFTSFVWPFRNWAVAAYVHQVASADLISDPLGVSDGEGFAVGSAAIAGAWRPSETFSLGLGLSRFTGTLTGPAVADGQTETDWGFNAGVLWSPLQPLNVGAFYRDGPQMEFKPAVAGDPALPLTLPTVYGVGVSLRPGAGHFVVGVEWDQVDYSGLLLSIDGTPVRAAADDVAEVHLGGEYVVLEWSPVVAFRLGVWREPGRSVTIAVPGSPESRRIQEGDDIHVAGGLGIAWNRVQLDLGVDHSDRESTVSVSMIYSF